MATPHASSIATPAPAAGGSNHQIVKAPSEVGYVPSHYNPVPVAAALQGGTAGAAYSGTIGAQGGTSPYTFALTAGALPTGTSLTGSTGVISGTPSATGTYTFTITVTDSLGYVGSQSFTIVIAAAAAGGSGGAFTFLG